MRDGSSNGSAPKWRGRSANLQEKAWTDRIDREDNKKTNNPKNLKPVTLYTSSSCRVLNGRVGAISFNLMLLY